MLLRRFGLQTSLQICSDVPKLGQAAESGFGFAEPFHDHQNIAERTGEAVEFPHHEHVSFAQLIEETVEFGPVPPSAGCLLAIDPLTSGRLQCRHLRGGFLIVWLRLGRSP